MLQRIVENYLHLYPDEAAALQPLVNLIERGVALDDRKNFAGHITGAALVLSPTKTRLLAVHHKLYRRWLQSGGHWEAKENDTGPWQAGAREAVEETGVQLARQLPVQGSYEVPLRIHTYPIPARPDKGEPPHDHFDFEYVFLAGSEELQHRPSENFACAWLEFDDARLDHGVVPMITRLREQHFIA